MKLLDTDVCTLPSPERPLRLAEFDSLFAQSLSTIETTGSTAVLTLSGPPGLGDRVRDLTARESNCCSFFTFTTTGRDDQLVLTITVPPVHSNLLASLVERAQKGRA